LKAAGAGAPAAQIESLHSTATGLQPLPPERIEQRKAAVADAWRKQTVWTDCAARSLLEWLGEQRARELVQMINNIGFGDSGSIWVFDRLRALLSRWTQ
jgi:hypothetical protein